MLFVKYKQPVLVEKYLAGREFTVGITGSGPHSSVLGTLEIILLEKAEKNVYSYVNKERCEELVEYRLIRSQTDKTVDECEKMSLCIWQALNCRDGGRIDFRCDDSGSRCPRDRP